MTESEFRSAVTREARTWLGTPYHHNGQKKGAGADCATFIFCVMKECGLLPPEEIGVFAPDWHCHVTEDVYLRRMRRHAVKVAEAITYPSTSAAAGMVVLLKKPPAAGKTGGRRIHWHGGLVIAWPKIIHCMLEGVEECDASRDPFWRNQPVTILDPWPKYQERQTQALCVGRDPRVPEEPTE